MSRVITVAAGLAVLYLSARAGVAMEPGLDYFTDAGPAIDTLVRGNYDEFFASQPLMGTFSLLVRAPLVATVFHSSETSVYLIGVLPCLVATIALGLVLARSLADRGASTTVQGVVAGLAVINPMTFRAIHWGHPEELLTGALCVAALLAALRQHELIAGILLGLAVSTKQWAVLAVLPTLLAASDHRLLLVCAAAGVTGIFTLPPVLLDPGAFERVATGAAARDPSAALTTPWNVWWPLSDLATVDARGPRYYLPTEISGLTHPLIVLCALPLSAALWRRRDRRRDDALLLLTLLLLLRCLLDHWNNDYYHVPFLLSLLAWESVRRTGVPYLTMGVSILLGVSFWGQQDQMFGDSVAGAPLLNAFYLAWAVPLALGLAATLYRPEAVRNAIRQVRGRPRAAIPAAS
jgi:4-amino-4-deoxy-L-arabinose transferase-like glycosyltransferase